MTILFYKTFKVTSCGEIPVQYSQFSYKNYKYYTFFFSVQPSYSFFLRHPLSTTKKHDELQKEKKEKILLHNLRCK